MSIVGIGTDLIELERIAKVMARFGERFLDRCYTAEEQRYCLSFRDPIPSLAARYAAKEAAAKALGTGIARGVLLTELEVVRLPGEAPQLRLHGRAAELAAQKGVTRTHLAMTHAREIAQAFVVFEAGPEK